MLTRTEIPAGADREAAEGLSAELAGSTAHFGSIIGALSFNYYINAWIMFPLYKVNSLH
jgi:hypothetical protein